MEQKRGECGAPVPWGRRLFESALSTGAAKGEAQSSNSRSDVPQPKAPPKGVATAALQPEEARPKARSGQLKWTRVKNASSLGRLEENEEEE